MIKIMSIDRPAAGAAAAGGRLTATCHAPFPIRDDPASPGDDQDHEH
jgi:hypothetical protein